MQLTIIKKNKLNTIDLPERISGSHWITDFENGRSINLMNIEEVNGFWQLTSNQDAYVFGNDNTMVPYVTLKDYSFYLFKNNYKNETNYLYCSPTIDKTFKELGINPEETITVGSSNDCQICYKLGGIPEKSFTISKEDNKYYLTILDPNTSVFLNQQRVVSKKRIEYGDIIFDFGLKIILMRRDTRDYLLVNNPNNLLEYNASMVNIVPTESDFKEDNSEITDDSMYKENSYFYRAPHFYKTVETLNVGVDTPPAKKGEDETPAIMTIGPMITMSMTSAVTLISTISSVSSGEKTAGASITPVIMSVAMLGSSLLWPTITRAYQKRAAKRYEKKRQEQYKNYINKIEKKIDEEEEKQKRILLDNNFDVKTCEEVIMKSDTRLWQRRLNDSDFLTLPVGLGNMPMKIEIKYPEEHFSLEEDNLLDIAHSLGQKERILENVPITYSFYETKANGIVGDYTLAKEFADKLMLQIMASYSYDEVKLVTLTTKDNEKDWNYMKVLPHSWSNDKAIRFFGADNEDYREIMYVLENIYKQRKEIRTESKHIPHYIIVTDAIKSIDNYDFLKEIMSSEENYGFSIIMLVDKINALPNECKNFIELSKESCAIFSSVINGKDQKFVMDFTEIDDIYECAKTLANIPLDIKTDAQISLPDVYHFLEMYQVGKVEQLNAVERWKKSNPILSLQAPIGIGKNGEVVALDLHEKYHGPHGLVAGTTGSGKSEFIITYILSLAVNYHPDEVQLILIDYKGGSLTGAFSNANYELPHLAGTITNLDGSELNRSLASIESEVKRRQREFNDAKNITGESTMDIYKYQKLYRQGKLQGKSPIAHLFIISDEFAELKEQQPEFMDKLISVARVGRALGVHLILATQKPGGVVDQQIWSNSRFKVCLKVQDTGDSQEVLRKPDAAYLKKTGRFYLQVGYDEVYTLGQSAWAGGQYYPSSKFKKDVDTSINIINNIGFVTNTKDVEEDKSVTPQGEEITNIVKYLCDLGHKQQIKIRKLWLPKISENIYITDLKSKYGFERKPFYLNPIIGEYDDPANQTQNALSVPFSKLGNSIIYGITGSGKEDFVSSLIFSLITSYSPQEVNFYIMDFGSETLKKFEKCPYVGDVVYLSESDKITNLIKMINNEIETRKKLFSQFGGSYQSYIESGKGTMPNIIVVLNNYEAFNENYEDYVDEISQITRECFKYGIYFVITATNDSSVRMKTKQNFSLVYALNQNNEGDYSNILGNVRGKLPAKNKGRGLFKRDNIYEFQTAFITSENENTILNDYFEKIKAQTNYQAKRIPVLPDKVNFNFVNPYLDSKYNLVVGVNKNNLNVEKYNFSKNAISLISSYEIENTYRFVNALIDEVIYTKGYTLKIVNTTESLFNKEVEEVTKGFDAVIDEASNYIEEVYKEYEENKFNDSILDNKEKKMYVIYGVHDFINKISDDSKKKLASLMKQNSQMLLASFVLVDTTDALKTYSYEDWFKTGTDTSRGIWIGSGIGDQTLIKVNRVDREDREEITNDYGYVVTSGKLYRIKLLSDFKG